MVLWANQTSFLLWPETLGEVAMTPLPCKPQGKVIKFNRSCPWFSKNHKRVIKFNTSPTSKQKVYGGYHQMLPYFFPNVPITSSSLLAGKLVPEHLMDKYDGILWAILGNNVMWAHRVAIWEMSRCSPLWQSAQNLNAGLKMMTRRENFGKKSIRDILGVNLMHFVHLFELSPNLSLRAAILLLSWFSILVLEETKFSFPINKMCALVIRVLRARPRGPRVFLLIGLSPVKAGPRATMDISIQNAHFKQWSFHQALYPGSDVLKESLLFKILCRIPFSLAYASYELCPKPHKGHKTSMSWFICFISIWC